MKFINNLFIADGILQDEEGELTPFRFDMEYRNELCYAFKSTLRPKQVWDRGYSVYRNIIWTGEGHGIAVQESVFNPVRQCEVFDVTAWTAYDFYSRLDIAPTYGEVLRNLQEYRNEEFEMLLTKIKKAPIPEDMTRVAVCGIAWDSSVVGEKIDYDGDWFTTVAIMAKVRGMTRREFIGRIRSY